MAREMKDSGIEWIGEIPIGWGTPKTVNRFGLIGSGTTPRTYEDDYYVDGEINWIQSGDLHGKYLKSTSRRITQIAFERTNTLKMYFPEYLVMAMYGASVGNLSIATIKACTNQACCVLIGEKDNLKYMYYVLTAAKEYLVYSAVGGTQPNVSQNVIKNLRIPLPSINEQQKIADFLDQKCAGLDTVLEKTRASIEEYKKLKQAVITQVVTKGARGEREMKDSENVRWGMIPSDWGLIRIKNCIIDLKSGLSSVTNDENAGESGYYVLRTSAVSTGVFLPKEVKPVLTSAINRLVCPVEKDTIVVSRMNTSAMVGTCAYVDSEYPNLFLPDKLWKIHIKKKYYTKYFWYAINSTPARSLFDEISTGASMSMQNISVTDFVNNYVTVPSLDEQREIVHYLDEKCKTIDDLIYKKEQYLSEIENYKKSLIYEYITGKKEVSFESTY